MIVRHIETHLPLMGALAALAAVFYLFGATPAQVVITGRRVLT